MNTNIINAELVQALRKCLPFVRRHAIISGGDGELTHAFALRVLVDAETRQQEEQRVKNIVAAEQKRERWLQDAISATLACARTFGRTHARKVLNRFNVRNVRAAKTEQLPLIERLMKMSPSDLSFYDYTVKYSKPRFPTAGWISGQEAKNQAARAVRPMPPSPVGGYAPATPPVKGCNCEVCMKYRRPYRFINLD